MNEEQKRALVGLLREVDAAQIREDEEGDAEVAWFYFREAIEDTMGLDRGALNTYEDANPEVAP